MNATIAESDTNEAILNAAIHVFGRFGYKKCSMDELAASAKLSKQGLYLHFSSKEEIFAKALTKYLNDGLRLAQKALSDTDLSLNQCLLGALDAWFGRHIDTFSPGSFDLLEASKHLLGSSLESYKSAFREKLAKALDKSAEFNRSKSACNAREVAQVLFMCGLNWKEERLSRQEFLQKMRMCIRVCCRTKN
jgi:TetR/AcrR family transcriptional regulator, regulator of autoinduction and epiphytic fitness